MRRIDSRIDVASEEFRLNRAHNYGLAQTLHARQQAARRERPARDLERLARQNKMFVHDRIELLLDPGTPFLELSSLAANSDYGGEVPGGGIVSGIGIVNGREVIIHADDASVKGGAWYPLTVKKIVRTLDIAIENRLPVVHLCDSAGGFLPLQSARVPRPLHGRADFSQPVDPVETRREAARARVRSLHRGRRLYSRVCATTTSSCAAPAPSFSAARRSSKPRPARTSRSRNSAAPTCTPASPAPAIIRRRAKNRRSRSARELVGQTAPPKKCDVAARRAGAAVLRSR